MTVATVALTCHQCGRAFTRSASLHRGQQKAYGDRAGRYCSMQCLRESRKRPDSYEERTCYSCGRRFTMLKTQIGQLGRGKFCSRECHSKSREQRDEIACLKCGKPIDAPRSARRRYCSAECYGRAPAKVVLQCVVCNAGFAVIPSQAGKRKTCSQACVSLYRHVIQQKDGSPARKRLQAQKWRRLRAEILERDGGRCSECGRTDGRMAVHHVVAWAKSADDSMGNLVALCNRCHAKTHAH